MRQWQPHGANLLPSWRKVVDDPARDDEMPARVVVTQRKAKPMVLDCHERADARGRDRDADNKAVSR